MEENKKSNVRLVVLVVILLLACVGMGTFIFFNKDKLITKENTTTNEKKETTNKTEKIEEKNKTEKAEETNKKEKAEEKYITEATNKTEQAEEKYITEATSSTIETRSCIGTYSGQGAISRNAETGKNTNGTITIDLKEDGTYKLTKSSMDQYWAGHYTIIENALLLKESPHICGPGADCSEKYTHILNISKDCSNISWGYGSIFFDPNFILTRNN